MDGFVGKYLSVNCGELGIYQGRIVRVSQHHVNLDQACCNGVPLGNVIEIPVKNIQTLEILDVASTSNALPKPRPGSSSQPSGPRVKVERPVPVRAEVREPVRRLENGGGRRDRQRLRDEEAFGSPIDPTYDAEFDFEKNLALFDKKAVYDEINASKPDLVRQVDKNNYRCNESVLQKQDAKFKQISVPQEDFGDYVTDAGLVVPAITPRLRQHIFSLAETAGLSFARQSELIGRACTETALHLLGGAHRLNPHNSHQRPRVAVLAGVHRSGLLATSAARQLDSHGVRTILFVEDPGQQRPCSDAFVKELQLLGKTQVVITNNVEDLRREPVDLIIMALANSMGPIKNPASPASQWAQSNKAAVMAIDPPPFGTDGVSAKCCVVYGLPLNYDPSNGRIYLCNVGIPASVFAAAGIEYLPPFGPKFVIPLHPNDG